MSLTKTTTQPAAVKATPMATHRVGAVAAALFGVALFITVASVNVPHIATDTELRTWWEQSGNRSSGLVSGLAAICAACLFAVVVNYLGGLRNAAKAPQWLAFARSMGAAVTAVWLVTGAARATVAHQVDVLGQPLPGTDVLRIVTAYNYTLLGLAGMAVLGLAILAISVVVLATRTLGRWLGYVGCGCAVVVLGAVLVQQGAYATPIAILWALCLAVAIWRQPEGVSSRTDSE
jgi:hypothetical protein